MSAETCLREAGSAIQEGAAKMQEALTSYPIPTDIANALQVLHRDTMLIAGDLLMLAVKLRIEEG